MEVETIAASMFCRIGNFDAWYKIVFASAMCFVYIK